MKRNGKGGKYLFHGGDEKVQGKILPTEEKRERKKVDWRMIDGQTHTRNCDINDSARSRDFEL